MVGIVKAISATVADEIAIHRFVETGFEPNDLTIADAGNGMTSKGTVDAEGRASLIVPAPALEPGRLIRINACRADIDEVSGERTFQRTVLDTGRNRCGKQSAWLPGRE